MKKIEKIIQAAINPQFIKSYLHGVCPLFELKELINEIDNVKNIIDIGSNKGQFILLANFFFPNSNILSFEPQKDVLQIQKKIINTNKIKFFNYGLGNKKKTQKFYVTRREDSSSFLKPTIKNDNKYHVKKIINVKINKLDEVIKINKLTRKTLLKLDVQGYELSVLKGSIKTLKNIDFIIAEISQQKIYKDQVTDSKLISFLIKNKFKIKKIINKTYKNNKPYQADVLFVRN
jgi:FkbM family methyltransferase